MTAYIIKSSISLLLMFGLYWFLLRKEKLFVFNRFFLVASVVFSLVLPFISIPVNFQATPQLNEIIPDFDYVIPEISTVDNIIPGNVNISQPYIEKQLSPIDISEILLVLYISGAILFLIRFLRNIYIIIRRTKSSEKSSFKGYRVVLTNDKTGPYCFFKSIFLNREDYLNGRINKELINHELEHVRQSHTIDIILIELVEIFYWFNPVHVLYDRAIRLNHEYLADSGVISDNNDIKSYAKKLLDFISGRNNMSLTSGLNHSFTKKRLLMMTKSKSRSNENIRIITSLIMVLVFFLFLSLKQSETQSAKMIFVPSEVYDTIRFMESDSTYNITTYSEGFYISNEVTNKEYREFTDWVKNNPDESIYQRKDISGKGKDPRTGRMREIIFHVPERIDVSGILAELIDSSALYKLNSKYTDYFTDKKYDNYPVVGVSKKMAEYYCLWKTKSETITTVDSSENGTGMVMSSDNTYRLPTEKEWEYLAQQTFNTKGGNKYNKAIQEVYKGDTNLLGLCHLADNVSEWVASEEDKNGITRGGSWNTGNDISARQVHDRGFRDGTTGFRILKSPNPKRTGSDYNRSVKGTEMTQNIIRGIVMTEDGKPLTGATISTAGTNNTLSAETTSFNGRFTMNDIQSGASFIIGCRGFKGQTLKADFTSEMVIKLVRDPDYKGKVFLDVIQDVNFRNPDFTPAKALAVIDGVIIDYKANLKVNPGDIKSLKLLTGKEAADKYSDKGKDGVVEISLYGNKTGSAAKKLSAATAPDTSKFNTHISVNHIENKGEIIDIPVSKIQSVSMWSYHNIDNIDKKEFGSISIMTRDYFKVKGRVVRENGKPLPGVKISASGNPESVTSDKKGSFLIEDVREGALLEFLLPGYEPYYLQTLFEVAFNLELTIELKKD
jgi:beta-lactamase regulating signal transducer with metallopeptidase domain/formylglycine-generating enzyme required for sulfatase activity